MAVPPRYATIKDYLEDVLNFLNAYHWVYSCPNTHIFVNKVIDRVPGEWLPFLKNLTNEELNLLSLGHLSDSAPDSLIVLFKKIERLKFALPKQTFSENFNFPNNSGVSQKKKHEILSLAPLIHETCTKHGCDFIVDVGTGLGYLPRLLHDKYKYRTLGIEGSSEKIRLAEIKQQKHPDSAASIKYLQHFVTNESDQQIKEALNEISMTRACITGLHACADLSVTVLELFIKLDLVKSLVIMPCCYHRLTQKDTGFENFPRSDLLKELSKKHNCGFLNVAFLRLACQGSADGFSNMTAAQHREHANNCLFRALLEDVTFSGNYQVRRLKRKSGKLKQSNPDVEPFETYLANLKHTHTLIGGEISDHQFLEKMREKWTQHKGNAYLIEALAAFQAAMQNICENVVLLDRVMFLKEQGVECFVVKVTDQGISPRCHALVAVKP